MLILDDLAEVGPAELFVLVSGDGRAERRETGRRGVAMVAFSSLRRLVAACGWGQPWVIMRPERVHQAARVVGATLVAVDVPVPEGHRYPEPQPSAQPDLEPVDPVDDQRLVYLPSRPFSSGQRTAELELQRGKRGGPLLLAYTSIEDLATGCGPYQPWVAVEHALLDEVAREAGAAGVVFNPVLVEQARHAVPVVDWTAAREEKEDEWDAW